jgi:hypothetical protein
MFVTHSLWIHGTKDQQTIAFTPAGMEYLRVLLAEYERNRPHPSEPGLRIDADHKITYLAELLPPLSLAV